jgi:type I restriction enzyme S subunit
MKNGWETKPLAELCEFQRGLTYAKGDEVVSSKNVVLRANNVDLSTNRLDFSELKYINDRVDVPKAKIVRMGSLLICTASGSKSHLGKVAFIDNDYGYAFGGFMGQITPRQSLVPKFLFHMMTSENYKEFIAALSDGANINNLKFDDLGKFQIPLPPLAEQQRIVGVLDEAFEGLATAKANAEKNLQNARALFESHLQSVFTQRGKGWIEKSLGDLCQIKTGKKDVNEGNPAGKYPFFTCAAAHTFSDNYSFDTEALLVAGNGNVGQVSYYSGKFEAYQRTYVLFDFKDVTAKYLFRVLDKRLSATVGKQKLGNTMPYIKIGMLMDFPVLVPPADEQASVTEHFNALAAETQRLAQIYEQKVTALEALKKSLLHQAFSGEL